MMKNKIITLILLFCTFLYSDNLKTLDISKSFNNSDIKSFLYCLEDKENNLTAEKVKELEILKPQNKTSLGYKNNTYWCKLNLTNNSSESISKIFLNPRPGMDFIDVHIYKENKILKYNLGDLVSPKNRTFQSNYSNFELTLSPYQSATIITKYKTVGVLEVAWHIYDFKTFLENESLNNIFTYLFLGFILAMAIYKIFIYSHIKDKEYLIYTFMMLSVFIAQFSLSGGMHLYLYDYIDPLLITLCNWVFVHLFLVLLWVFTYLFFNIDKKNKFHIILKIVIVYNIIITILYTLSYFNLEILKITQYVAKTAFIESILLLIFSLVMFIRKKAGSGFFLIGHLLYVLCVINYIMVLNGTFEYTTFNKYSPNLGLFLVILFMSLALSKKIKRLKEQNQISRKIIETNKQYTIIGTTISFITHQWKQPLSILGSKATYLMAKIDHAPESKIEEVKPIVKDIEKNILSINETMNDIKELFKNDDKDINEKINLKEIFKTIQTSKLNLLASYNIDFQNCSLVEQSINGNRNLLIHALSNIIQNSIEELKNVKKDKVIKIIYYDDKDNIIIKILDKAGGIKIKPLENIFNPSVTTKTFGMGIGLNISKNIIESQFQGKIDVNNIEDGCQFIIKLPKKLIKVSEF